MHTLYINYIHEGTTLQRREFIGEFNTKAEAEAVKATIPQSYILSVTN